MNLAGNDDNNDDEDEEEKDPIQVKIEEIDIVEADRRDNIIHSKDYNSDSFSHIQSLEFSNGC